MPATTPNSVTKPPKAKVDMQGFTASNQFGVWPDAKARAGRNYKETPFGGS